MKTIQKLYPKPSDGVRAMIDGLIRMKGNPIFQVDMDSFIDYNENTKKCYGCAATCALLESVPKPIVNSMVFDMADGDRANIWGISKVTLQEVENYIDDLRRGRLFSYLRAFEGNPRIIEFQYDWNQWTISPLPYLNTLNWEEHLHEYENLYHCMIAFGI